jgi:hypothetical protein
VAMTGPIKVTAGMTEALRLLRSMTESERGLVLCWFCSACRRYVGPGDSCDCENERDGADALIVPHAEVGE